MSKALVTRSRAVSHRYTAIQRSRGIQVSATTILLVAGVALLIWFLVKEKVPTPVASYQNAETWSIKYNDDGLPTEITVHRDARQN